jgi:hypothetical protein
VQLIVLGRAIPVILPLQEHDDEIAGIAQDPQCVLAWLVVVETIAVLVIEHASIV